MAVFQLDIRPATRIAGVAALYHLKKPAASGPRPNVLRVGSSARNITGPGNGLAVKKNAENNNEKPDTCTADELHYVTVSGSEWRLALWRYLPSPKAKPRNHPLLLLSGLGTNAIGFDLSPESSFARSMSNQGFDTWTLEVRGAGLSALVGDHGEGKQPLNAIEAELTGRNSVMACQIRDLSQKLVNIIEGQRSVAPHIFGFPDNFSTALEKLLKQLDLIEKYDWDFDHHLEDDLPAVIGYIRSECRPKDGKLLAIGHSMGGILLYALISRCCFEGMDPGLASVITLGSSLDYTSSKSSLKLLLPVVSRPCKGSQCSCYSTGALLSAAHTFASRPPYVLSWLNPQISAPGMMHPELLEKLVLNNFCTVPAKLLLQLTTAFEDGGLRDRSGSFLYKDHLGKTNVPVLAIAGDQDLICPPEAVYGSSLFCLVYMNLQLALNFEVILIHVSFWL
ncbi:alpha/beta hydrolase family protein [Salix suchowensis]|nr:alpha/beta hydrolase family protein [Salix suchowensis]